jgi:uncharacterized damage-inducible protein DinB
MALFQSWFEQESDSNAKMLAMLESVPENRREAPEYRRAVNLAGHLVACRNNWLLRMRAESPEQEEWWPNIDSINDLRTWNEGMEGRWREYLRNIDEHELSRDFEFVLGDGRRVRWNICGQIMQLVGHSFYHRGQIAMLVDSLGGVTVDTDYLYWAMTMNPKYGVIEG